MRLRSLRLVSFDRLRYSAFIFVVFTKLFTGRDPGQAETTNSFDD
jgi:hypothetical protein